MDESLGMVIIQSSNFEHLININLLNSGSVQTLSEIDELEFLVHSRMNYCNEFRTEIEKNSSFNIQNLIEIVSNRFVLRISNEIIIRINLINIGFILLKSVR